MAKPARGALAVPRDALAESLARIVGAVERRPSLPILECCLLQADPTAGRLSLTATDLSIQLIAHLALEQSAPFSACLPARKLLSLVKALPEGAEITLQNDGEQAVLRSGPSRFKLAARRADEYPAFDLSTTEATYAVDGGELRAGLAAVAPAMAVDDVRYYLNGARWRFTDDALHLAASDGHRAARYRVPLISDAPPRLGPPRELILAARSVHELIRLLPEDAGTVPLECRCSGNTLAVDLADCAYASRLMEGQYPDLDRVFPTSYTQEGTIDRRLLADAVKRVAVITHDMKFRAMAIAVSPTGLSLSATNELQEESSEDVAWEGGGDFSLALNSDYLLDALGALNSPLVVLQINANGPNRVTPHLEHPAPGDYLIMPIRK